MPPALSSKERIILGGLGALTPVIVNLVILDLEVTLSQATRFVVLGYALKVLALFYLGAMVAYLHSDEHKAFKLFQLGIVAPALIVAALNAQVGRSATQMERGVPTSRAAYQSLFAVSEARAQGDRDRAMAARRLFPPAGAVLVTEDVATSRREVYVAAAALGQILVFDAESLERRKTVTIASPPASRSRPLQVAIAPSRGANGEIYVVDGAQEQIVIIDARTHAELGRVGVGRGPRWIAITPGQRKAYVSNEQPIPQGTISVIDLEQRRVVSTITSVNCPEGLAVTPDGRRLWVATQCGGGEDPVFIIDTSTEQIVTALRGFAVGLTVAIAPDGKLVYVARGAFQTRLDQFWRGVGLQTEPVPSQVSVIAATDYRVLANVRLSAVGPLAITGDGKYILIGGEQRIAIIDAFANSIVQTIPLTSSPAGIAVSNDRAYIWLPGEQRVFLVRLSGLRP